MNVPIEPGPARKGVVNFREEKVGQKRREEGLGALVEEEGKEDFVDMDGKSRQVEVGGKRLEEFGEVRDWRQEGIEHGGRWL